MSYAVHYLCLEICVLRSCIQLEIVYLALVDDYYVCIKLMYRTGDSLSSFSGGLRVNLKDLAFSVSCFILLALYLMLYRLSRCSLSHYIVPTITFGSVQVILQQPCQLPPSCS